MKIIPALKVRDFILAAIFFVGLGIGNSGSAQQRPYLVDLNSKTVTDIGTLGGTGLHDRTTAHGINDTGEVVGVSTTTGGALHAFITGPQGTGMRDLGTLGGTYSEAFGINDTGQVVGFFSPAGISHDQHAFITGPNGAGMRDLGTLGGTSYSVASGINDAGQVVGTSNKPGGGGVRHAFITGANGMGLRDLGTLGDHDYSSALAINGTGQVVGDSVADGWTHAFITGPNGMGMRDLGTLGDMQSWANDINDAGQVRVGLMSKVLLMLSSQAPRGWV